MIHTFEDCPGSGNRRKYSKASIAVVGLWPGGSILQSSIQAENVDVSVEEFENVHDADANDFFKVDFE